jgi:hypothetical protein
VGDAVSVQEREDGVGEEPSSARLRLLLGRRATAGLGSAQLLGGRDGLARETTTQGRGGWEGARATERSRLSGVRWHLAGRRCTGAVQIRIRDGARLFGFQFSATASSGGVEWWW